MRADARRGTTVAFAYTSGTTTPPHRCKRSYDDPGASFFIYIAVLMSYRSFEHVYIVQIGSRKWDKGGAYGEIVTHKKIIGPLTFMSPLVMVTIVTYTSLHDQTVGER